MRVNRCRGAYGRAEGSSGQACRRDPGKDGRCRGRDGLEHRRAAEGARCSGPGRGNHEQ